MLLYDGSTGMPYEVPYSEVESYLKRGFRSAPPFPPVSAAASGIEAEGEPVSIPPSSEASHPAGVNVNTASLKELAALPLVGTAIAKQVRDNRPYRNVEDLLDKVPGVEWLTINSQLSYDHDAAD